MRHAADAVDISSLVVVSCISWSTGLLHQDTTLFSCPLHVFPCAELMNELSMSDAEQKPEPTVPNKAGC